MKILSVNIVRVYKSVPSVKKESPLQTGIPLSLIFCKRLASLLGTRFFSVPFCGFPDILQVSGHSTDDNCRE